MKYPAKYISSTKIDRNYIEQMFEYRGEYYLVTKPLSWTGCSSDYFDNGYMSLRNQHRRAQEGIDGKLDNRSEEPEIRTGKSEAEKALDILFDYMEGNENAFDNL